MRTRVFYHIGGIRYIAVPEDYRLEKSFRVTTPEGVLDYYIYDGERFRKTYYVLIRQNDGNFRVYYRPKSGRKFLSRIATAYFAKPVRTIPPNRLSELLEPEHIRQLREAEKLLPFAEPIADIS